MAAAAVAAGGCIGPDLPPVDPSAPFAGVWRGESIIAVDAEPAGSTAASTRIVAVAADAIYIASVCGDGRGPYAVVARDGSFTIGPVRCTSRSAACPDVSLEYGKGGTGALTGDDLTMSMTGKLTTCGKERPVKLHFSGRREGS